MIFIGFGGGFILIIILFVFIFIVIVFGDKKVFVYFMVGIVFMYVVGDWELDM